MEPLNTHELPSWLPLWLIGAVNGPAIGWGVTLLLFWDIRIAAESAKFSAMYPRRGLAMEGGASWLLPRIVGLGKALELAFTARTISANDALELGLVNHVVPRSDVLAKAREIALELAHGPTWAIRWTKLSINQIVKERVNMLLEASMALEQVTFETADHKEATMSFKEKRKPKFGQK